MNGITTADGCQRWFFILEYDIVKQNSFEGVCYDYSPLSQRKTKGICADL